MDHTHQNRRKFLRTLLLGSSVGLVSGGAGFVLTNRAIAQAVDSDLIPNLASNLEHVQLRGTLDATPKGLLPDVIDDQSKIILDAIKTTALQNKTLFLPAGTYYISNLDLPDNTRITGIHGATRLVYTGRGHALIAENIKRLELRDIIIDGANQTLGNYTNGLIQLRGVSDLILDGVHILGSSKYGLALEQVGGVVRNCDIMGARDAGIYALQSRNLTIRDNYVHDCANGGIFVHRWQIGDDGTIVKGNRIARIQASDGGTGQFGNGINVFRSGNVMVSQNHITDCAFSAIRANSASNIQITNNACHNSGETALYVEFQFQGAVVAGNLIDGGTMGISIANFNENGRLSVVSGNLIRNITDQGPYPAIGPGFGYGIAIEADANVTGNTIENVAKWGLLVGWGPYLRNVVITSNIIRKAPIGIGLSVVDGIGSVGIHNNIFDETPKGAIIGHQWNDAVTRDLIGKKTRFDQLSLSGNQLN